MRACKAKIPAVCRFHGWLDAETYGHLSPRQIGAWEQKVRHVYLANLFMDGFTAEDIVMATMGPEGDGYTHDNLALDFIPTTNLKTLCMREGLI